MFSHPADHDVYARVTKIVQIRVKTKYRAESFGDLD